MFQCLKDFFSELKLSNNSQKILDWRTSIKQRMNNDEISIEEKVDELKKLPLYKIGTIMESLPAPVFSGLAKNSEMTPTELYKIAAKMYNNTYQHIW